MDEVDNRLIAALRHDGRLGLSDLATRLNVSRATVRTRMTKLQEQGEILGFTVVTAADVARDPVRGLMMIGIEGRGTERVSRQLTGMAEVRAVHATNGQWDVIIEIGTETLEQFDAVLTRIRRLEGIVSSETSLLLRTSKRS